MFLLTISMIFSFLLHLFLLIFVICFLLLTLGSYFPYLYHVILNHRISELEGDRTWPSSLILQRGPEGKSTCLKPTAGNRASTFSIHCFSPHTTTLPLPSLSPFLFLFPQPRREKGKIFRLIKFRRNRQMSLSEELHVRT